MEILEAYDLTRCAHSAARLAGVDEKTVARYVAIRDSGRDPLTPTRRVRAGRGCTGDHPDYGGEADQPRSSSAWPPTTGRPPHVTRE